MANDSARMAKVLRGLSHERVRFRGTKILRGRYGMAAISKFRIGRRMFYGCTYYVDTELAADKHFVAMGKARRWAAAQLSWMKDCPQCQAGGMLRKHQEREAARAVQEADRIVKDCHGQDPPLRGH